MFISFHIYILYHYISIYHSTSKKQQNAFLVIDTETQCAVTTAQVAAFGTESRRRAALRLLDEAPSPVRPGRGWTVGTPTKNG